MLAVIGEMKPGVGIEPKVTLDTMTFTPSMAETWLARASRPNRKIKESVVDQYARVMTAGGWRINGEPIILDGVGRILNGYHRLNAVVRAGVPVQMLVVRGVADDAFATIDTGRSRTLPELAGMLGYDEARGLATAASLLWKFEKSGGTFATNQRPTNAESLEVISRHESQLVQSLAAGKKVEGMLGLGAATFCHAVFARVDQKRADDFFESLSTGENLQRGRAVLMLREILLADRASRRKMTPIYKLAIVFKAFIHEKNGTTVKFLRWRQVGPAKEAFPTL